MRKQSGHGNPAQNDRRWPRPTRHDRFGPRSPGPFQRGDPPTSTNRNPTSDLPAPPHPATDEKGPDFYDEVYDRVDSIRAHYTRSGHYPVWLVAAERIARARVRSVLDIGCGSGQLACLLRDMSAMLVDSCLESYHGFDFSPKRVEHATHTCPQYTFEVADAYQTDLFDTVDYDAAVCLEFLEHVARDVDVIRRLRPGTWFCGSVPNFPYDAHVRHFVGEQEVRDRYQPLLAGLCIHQVRESQHSEKIIYVMEGRIR